MASYTLKLFRARSGSVKEGIGSLTFNAGDDHAAVKYAHEMYAEGLTDCDYAAVFGHGDKLVWEKGNPDA